MKRQRGDNTPAKTPLCKEKIMDKDKIWDTIGYANLALCIIGQITVGYFYLLAQTAYLVANGIGVVRSFALKRPVADKMKDIVFFAITVALIILKLI